jgi:hypothetical protein
MQIVRLILGGQRDCNMLSFQKVVTVVLGKHVHAHQPNLGRPAQHAMLVQQQTLPWRPGPLRLARLNFKCHFQCHWQSTTYRMDLHPGQRLSPTP